ncbi:hypothetical protein ABZ671_20130 [Micromonospora sp. NPDC006766]|uniref:ATP-binding protein n=1 Tax=Micromonospora sp. NPDC006766 TaxID=3154778 RepID=UPI0033D626AB
MSALILHRNPFEPFPYDRWLADYEGELVVLAARDRFEMFAEPVPTDNLGYTHLEVIDAFDDVELVRGRALALAEEFDVRHVVAHHEADVLLAASLREQLDLPGAWPRDVHPFRDKALMKRRLRAAGIEVAEHIVPRTARDAVEFVDRHGLPVVLKDRAGYNSIGLRILRERDTAVAAFERAFGDAERDDLLLEAYVPGRMCHVDGLVVDGRMVLAWPSQYQYDLASYGTDPGARVDLTLDHDDPLTAPLIDLTERALAALYEPDGRLRDHAFHAEIFHTPDGRLVVCEIACRPGGAKVREVLAAIVGVNIGEYATRAELGLHLPGLAATLAGGERLRPSRMGGQVLLMKRPGYVKAVPPPPEEPWVERFWRYAEPGQVIPPASGSSDFLACAVATGGSRSEAERRLRSLGARFESQIEIVELP